MVFSSGPVHDCSLLATEEEQDREAVWRRCMNSRIPRSAEFSGVHFKKRLKVLRHSPQRGSANGAAEDGGVVFSPGQRRDQGVRSTFSVCLSLRRLPPPRARHEGAKQGRTNELCRTRIQLTCPHEDSGTHEESVFWGAGHKVEARLSSQNN